MSGQRHRRGTAAAPRLIRVAALNWGDEPGIALDHRAGDSLVTGNSMEENVVL